MSPRLRFAWLLVLAALAVWCVYDDMGRRDECELHGIAAEQCREALYR